MRSSRALAITGFLLFALLVYARGPGFRTQDMLADHYARHGHEFGHISEQQYLRLAQHLRDSRAGKEILESRRSDGGGAKFDVRRGWFVAYNSDGTIRTFFVPAEGVRYFESQARTYGARSRR